MENIYARKDKKHRKQFIMSNFNLLGLQKEKIKSLKIDVKPSGVGKTGQPLVKE